MFYGSVIGVKEFASGFT